MAVLQGDKALMDKLNKLVKDMGAGTLSVGFQNGALYPDGTPVAAVAFWNEFGTGKIPARPFFRTMIAEKSTEWGGTLAALLAKNPNSKQALNNLGEGIHDQLDESITNWTTPANAQSTRDKKGFNDPLVDTGHMKNSITSVVE